MDHLAHTPYTFQQCYQEAVACNARGKKGAGKEAFDQALQHLKRALELASGHEERRLALEEKRISLLALGQEREAEAVRKEIIKVVTAHSLQRAEAEAKSKHIVTDRKKDLP